MGIALLAGACGSDDDEGGALPASSAPSSDEAELPEPEPEPQLDDPVQGESDDESVAPEPTTGASLDDSEATGAPGDEPWCGVLDEADEVEVIFSQIQTMEPAEVQAGLERIEELLPIFTEAAPPEILTDMTAIVEQAEMIIAAFADANWTFLDLDLTEFQDLDYQTDVDATNRAVDLFSLDLCDRPFGSPSPDPADEVSTDGFDPGEGTIREQAIASLVEAGFTEAEVNCILEKVDFTDPEALGDPQTLLPLFEECNISLERLAELGGG